MENGRHKMSAIILIVEIACKLKKFYHITNFDKLHYMSVIEDFKQLLTIKRYSPRTIETYTNALRQFLTFFHPKSPESIDVKEIEAFISEQVTRNGISASYQKQLVGSIKLLYNEVYRRNLSLNYLYPDRSSLWGQEKGISSYPAA